MLDQNSFYEILFRLIQNKKCYACQINGPNYKTACDHYFHLSCLANLYHENPLSCPECRQMLSLDFIKINEEDKCFACSSTSNLQKFDCNHFYCAACLLGRKPALDCCKKIAGKYFEYIVTCPLCQDEVTLDKCSTVICYEHGIICKKCHNYSFLNKECIGKCGRKVKSAFFSYCFSCSNREVMHFSNKRCKGGCEICINCYLWFFINFGVSKSCYVCSEMLV